MSKIRPKVSTVRDLELIHLWSKIFISIKCNLINIGYNLITYIDKEVKKIKFCIMKKGFTLWYTTELKLLGQIQRQNRNPYLSSRAFLDLSLIFAHSDLKCL